MTLDTIIMLVGTMVAALPFLGLPLGMQNLLFLVIGVGIISFGIIERRKYSSKVKNAPPPPVRHSDFVESTPHQSEHPIEIEEESLYVEHESQ